MRARVRRRGPRVSAYPSLFSKLVRLFVVCYARSSVCRINTSFPDHDFTFRGHKDKIFVIRWNPQNNDLLVTAGIKHIKFWTQTGGGFTSKRGTFGSVGKPETLMCVTFGKNPEMMFSGGSSGKVFIWQGLTLKSAVQAHEGPVFAVQTLEKV